MNAAMRKAVAKVRVEALSWRWFDYAQEPIGAWVDADPTHETPGLAVADDEGYRAWWSAETLIELFGTNAEEWVSKWGLPPGDVATLTAALATVRDEQARRRACSKARQAPYELIGGNKYADGRHVYAVSRDGMDIMRRPFGKTLPGYRVRWPENPVVLAQALLGVKEHSRLCDSIRYHTRTQVRVKVSPDGQGSVSYGILTLPLQDVVAHVPHTMEVKILGARYIDSHHWVHRNMRVLRVVKRGTTLWLHTSAEDIPAQDVYLTEVYLMSE